MNSTITITQIAKESGVSIATVSRYLNGQVFVAEDKRQRIEAIVKKYDFKPNPLARGLISKKTMTLGVILPDITNPYFAIIFQEIQRCAAEAGYSVLLCNTRFHQGAEDIDETLCFQMMMDKHVDGTLVIGGQIDLIHPDVPYKEALKKLGSSMPVVVAGQPIEDTNCIFIESESGKGVTTAYNYLRTLGHQSIAFIGGQPGVIITEYRLDAYKKARLASGLNADETLIVLSDYYAPDGWLAAKTLLERNTSFTAVIAMNDNVSLGVIRALADSGISVPQDVALISCDQFYYSEYTTPRLTGINQHNQLWGQMVVQTLIQAIKGNRETAKISLPPELIIRESCTTKLIN